MLIDSLRITAADRAAWQRISAVDPIWAQTGAFRRAVERARSRVQRFVARGAGYASVSWGKDSLVLAHLVAIEAPSVPVVWVEVEGRCPPECHAVMAVFARRYPNVALHVRREAPDGAVHPKLRGFAWAVAEFGRPYLSGVRGAESSARRQAQRAGAERRWAVMPILDWSARDVWAYLALHDLPIHPVYAMTLGGRLDRDQLRMGTIGGDRGRGWGRAEWEQHYYPEMMR